MTARDREHDEWIPWYVEDSPGWLELSLAARGAMEGIARKLNRRTGQLALRRGLPSLALLLHVPWSDLEPAIAELIEKGKVTWDGSTLFDPDYSERKRRSGADRQAEYRARKKGESSPVSTESVTRVTDVTSPPSRVTPGDARDGCSSLVLSSLISSESGSQTREADGPPDWWASVLEQIHAQLGEELPAAAAWLRYDGHRAGKGIEPTRKDALYWLTTVMVREQKDAREEAHRRNARDGERTKAIVRERHGPEVKPLPSVAPLMREREKWAQEAASPQQSAEAAANLRKLLGGVGR
jgi:hypothetical protein